MAIICVVTFNALASVDVNAESAVISASEPRTTSAQLKLFNRTVAVFRAPLMGVPVEERAERAGEVLRRMLAKGGKGDITSQKVPQGYAIMVDGVQAFFLVPEDADQLRQETLEQLLQNVVADLNVAAKENAEARNMSKMMRSSGLTLAATAIFVLLVMFLHRARQWIAIRLVTIANNFSEKLSIGGELIIHRDRIFSLVRHTISLFFWLITLGIIFNWAGYVLARFPYTRPWGEQLTQYLLDMGRNLIGTILKTVPGLLVSILIFLGAHLLISMLKNIFDRIEQGGVEFAGLDRDTIRPTKRLVAIGIWLFALAMAYPYLPGAQTEAFKGLSVLVGLMVSLGGSSLVGQAASGLILMYTRTLRPGEFVKIADNEGTVTELGIFTTRIRTGLGEELTLPNALILGNVTRNYSRTVQGPGYILETTVTIGYDTPWRQVHAMLEEASLRTSGVLSSPAPRVFQTALADYYPQYRLVCQAVPSEPLSRAEVMNTLHANIQDVFNEYGVQIMSPHYIDDPEHPKLVPKEKWHTSPAKK